MFSQLLFDSKTTFVVQRRMESIHWGHRGAAVGFLLALLTCSVACGAADGKEGSTNTSAVNPANFAAMVMVYSEYCNNGTPQGPFQLDACVSLGFSASIGGGRCSSDGNWIFYTQYSQSTGCGGSGTPMKAATTSCQGGNGMSWYLPYCQ
jgi:hypothetical protein